MNVTRLIETNMGMYTDQFVWVCEKCDESFEFNAGTPQDNNYNYCCNCGAKIVEYVNYEYERFEDEGEDEC